MPQIQSPWPYKTYGPEEVSGWQKYTDKFLASTLLRFIPQSVTPNAVSWVRILSLPFILYLLLQESYGLGLTIFIIAALTDALDGAMARTRDQVTERGKVLDAVADRGLIFLVAFVFIPALYGWPLLFYIIALEALNGLMSYRSQKQLGHAPGANWAGKVKMIIQSVAFGFIFIGLFIDSQQLIGLAGHLLNISLGFNLMQSFLYPRPAGSLSS